MKFYILKDQPINLTINDGDNEYIVRCGTHKITNVITFGKGSPVANEICKKLNAKLTDVRNLSASTNDDHGGSSRKRPRVSDQGSASLDIELSHHPCDMHLCVDGKATGLIEQFQNILQISPENMLIRVKGTLNFQESGLNDTSNPIKRFGCFETMGEDLQLTKQKGGSYYGFSASVALKAGRSNPNSEEPRELWEGHLSFTGIFTVTLTVKGIDKKFFMDEDIDDKMLIPKRLLTEELDCDVKIVLDNGEVIPCHKTFLSAHSEVFASMLNGSFVEGLTKKIKLPGKTEKAIRALLAYLYYWDTSAAFADPEIAVQLFTIAHEYNINSLGKCMVKILKKRCTYEPWLNTEMAISLLPYIRSEKDMSAIKHAVGEFFVENWKEIQESESFKESFEKNPDAAIDLFGEVCDWKNMKVPKCDSK